MTTKNILSQHFMIEQGSLIQETNILQITSMNANLKLFQKTQWYLHGRWAMAQVILQHHCYVYLPLCVHSDSLTWTYHFRFPVQKN